MSGPTKKEQMLEALRARRANPPTKIDNAALPAGAPMYFYCISCNAEIVVPETYISRPKLCGECQDLKDLGWLDE